MRALTWQGKQKVGLMNVPDPRILGRHPRARNHG